MHMHVCDLWRGMVRGANVRAPLLSKMMVHRGFQYDGRCALAIWWPSYGLCPTLWHKLVQNVARHFNVVPRYTQCRDYIFFGIALIHQSSYVLQVDILVWHIAVFAVDCHILIKQGSGWLIRTADPGTQTNRTAGSGLLSTGRCRT